MMEPPKNATESAAGAPCVCAAVVVRTLALVAVYMPIHPGTGGGQGAEHESDSGRRPEAGRHEQDDEENPGEKRQHQVLPAHEHHGAGVDLIGYFSDVVLAFGIALDQRIDDEGAGKPDKAEYGRKDGLLQHGFPYALPLFVMDP